MAGDQRAARPVGASFGEKRELFNSSPRRKILRHRRSALDKRVANGWRKEPVRQFEIRTARVFSPMVIESLVEFSPPPHSSNVLLPAASEEAGTIH